MFKELKCPNCTAAVKVSGNLATCTRCGSNFLLDIPANSAPPQKNETESETIKTFEAQVKPAQSQIETSSTTKATVRLTPIAYKAINWTTVLILNIFIWAARLWFGLGIFTMIAVLTPTTSNSASNVSSNIIFYIITFVIMFGAPSYFVHRLATRKRDSMLETDSVIEVPSTSTSTSSNLSPKPNLTSISNPPKREEVVEPTKVAVKQSKPAKRQIKSVRVPHGMFGGANTRKIERTSRSLLQKGFTLTHQNDQPARGCLSSGYTLLTFVKE